MDNIRYVFEGPAKIVFFGLLSCAIVAAPFINIDGMNIIQYLLQ